MSQHLAPKRENIFPFGRNGTRLGRATRSFSGAAQASLLLSPGTISRHVHDKKSRYFFWGGGGRRLFDTGEPRPAQPLAAKMAAPPEAPLTRRGSPRPPARGDRPAPRRPPPSSSAAAAAALGSPCRREGRREGGGGQPRSETPLRSVR